LGWVEGGGGGKGLVFTFKKRKAKLVVFILAKTNKQINLN
jgi:hypothetical protein